MHMRLLCQLVTESMCFTCLCHSLFLILSVFELSQEIIAQYLCQECWPSHAKTIQMGIIIWAQLFKVSLV